MGSWALDVPSASLELERESADRFFKWTGLAVERQFVIRFDPLVYVAPTTIT